MTRLEPVPVVHAVLAVLLTSALLGGCRTGAAAPKQPTEPAKPPPAAAPAPDREFDRGTEHMQAVVRSSIREIPGASEARRLEIAGKIVQIGEPGIPILIEALSNQEPEVRSLAAWILGVEGDRRAVPALRAATADPVPYVALEAANALLAAGDDAGLVRLVDGLEDRDPRMRARSFLALEKRTKRTMDYHPDDSPSDRAAAVARWREWLRTRT